MQFMISTLFNVTKVCNKDNRINYCLFYVKCITVILKVKIKTET